VSRNWGIPRLPIRAPSRYSEIAWRLIMALVLIAASVSTVFMVIAIRYFARMVFPHA
jgi:hypothetical protein